MQGRRSTKIRRRIVTASRALGSAVSICAFNEHYFRVHYISMKNITLSADEDLIEQARLVARAQRKTLNAAFREWMAQFAGLAGNAQEAESLMKRLGHVQAGRQFFRDEMNER
jgi:hypothetical protein